jgi:hypothetical protein
MRVFIAGVMQGSRTDDRVTSQQYRKVITRILRENLDEVDIIDPWAVHPNSEEYDTERARETFMSLSALAGQVDVLVAYVPEASMGTAIEIWEAHRSGAKVFSISEMSANWVVKLLSLQVFPTLEDFASFVAQGGLEAASDAASALA